MSSKAIPPNHTNSEIVKMDILRSTRNTLPTRLFRVEYETARSSSSSISNNASFPDLLAADEETTFLLHDEQQPFLQDNAFKQAIKAHCNWDKDEKSPFLSVFSDKEDAIQWGLAAPWNCNRRGAAKFDFKVYEFETTLIASQVYIYELERLMSRIHITFPKSTKRGRSGLTTDDEYLVLHRIPGSSIVECQGREDFV
ncbi:hypothetical protein MMC10_003510 [Thelotrema lepadinum]|nr:hypothetical protein [Thelotrema lepadinum]